MNYQLLELGAQYKVGLISLKEFEQALSIINMGSDSEYFTVDDVLYAVETANNAMGYHNQE